MKKVFIFSLKVARDLVQNDFTIIDLAENQKDRKRTVYVFQNTKEIRDYLKEKWDIDIK